MHKTDYGRRGLSLFLSMCLIVSMACYRDMAFAAADDAVHVDVGIGGLHISLSSDDLPKPYEAEAGSDGKAEFTELYNYLAEDLGWSESDPAPDKTEITVSYDVNYADVTPIEKHDSEKGDYRYEGVKGEFVLSMDPASDEGEQVFNWTEEIVLEAPEEIEYLEGMVRMAPYGQTPTNDNSVAVEGAVITTTDDAGQPASVSSGAEGMFDFTPYVRAGGVDDRMIEVAETEEHYAYEKTLKALLEEDDGIVYLTERFEAAPGTEYNFGEGVVVGSRVTADDLYVKTIPCGYVKAAGSYEVIAAEGYKVGFEMDGPFTDRITLNVEEGDTCETFYVQNEAGKVSKAIENVLVIDGIAPEIESVEETRETEGEDITFTGFGIFTSKEADFTVRFSVIEAGSGIDKIYLVSDAQGERKTFEALTANFENSKTMKATFIIPADADISGKTLSIVATDKLGQESDPVLLRQSAEESTIFIEANAPVLSDITPAGDVSENGWYSDDVTFTFTALDTESGLKKVVAEINGKEVLNTTYAQKLQSELCSYSFTLTKAMMEEMNPENGEFVITVTAEDNCGNTESKSITIKADVTAPEVRISGAEEGGFYQSLDRLTIESNDIFAAEEGATIKVSTYIDGEMIDEKEFAAKDSAQLSGVFTKEGRYEVKAYAMDAAGNKSETATIHFIIDKTEPEIEEGEITGGEASKSGWYSGAITYHFKAEDTLSGMGKCTATVNGKSVPCEDGVIELTEALIKELAKAGGAYTIVITATDKAGNSNTFTKTLYIDITDPAVTIRGAENGGIYQKGPDLTIETDEANYSEPGSFIQIDVTRNGESYTSTTYEKTKTVDIAGYTEDGQYVVKAYAVDTAGNKSETATLRFIIDHTEPVIVEKEIAGAQANENGWYDGPITYHFEASDETSGIASCTATINGKSVSCEGGVIELTKALITELEEKGSAYTIEITAKDKADNSKTFTKTIHVDIVAPIVSIQGAENGAFYQKGPDMTIKAEEANYSVNGAYLQVEVTRNGESYGSDTYAGARSAKIEGFTKDGQYVVKAYAVDAAGNKSETATLRFIIDHTAPIIEEKEITGAQANENGWYDGPITYHFGVSDETAGVSSYTATVNGKKVACEDGKIVLTKALIRELEEKGNAYTIKITATDKAENSKTFTTVLYIDIKQPKVSFSGAEDGSIYQNAPKLTVENDEANFSEKGAFIQVRVKHDDKVISDKTYAKAQSVSLSDFDADGIYTVTAYAVDAAGNISEKGTLKFMVDGTKPVINVTGVQDAKANANGWYNKPLTYAFAVSDKTAGIAGTEVTVNGEKVAYDGQSIALTKELIAKLAGEDGTYAIKIAVTDKAGNKKTYADKLKIDIVRPVLSLSGINKGQHYANTPTLTIANDEAHYSKKGGYVKVEIERDGNVVSTKTYPKTASLDVQNFAKDGDYTVTVSAVDPASNSAKVKKVSFVKDSTAPVITLSGAEEGKFYSEAKTIRVQVDERYYKTDSVQITVTRTLDGNTSAESFPWTNSGIQSVAQKAMTATGTYKVQVSARDEAGNTAISKSLSFTVDTVAPQVKISGVSDGQVFTYDDLIAPQVDFSDSYFANKEVTITRAGSDWYGNLAKSDNGTKLTFADFEKIKDNDGQYHMEVVATDKAGNSTREKIDFAVNRFGSFFTYGEILKNLNGKYVQEVTENLVIEERNISELDSSVNEIKRDGQVMDGIVTTSREGEKDGYQVYRHIFPVENFREEGVYQLNVLSKDIAGNEMESQEDVGAVKFYVDRTAPVINTSGLDQAYVNADETTILVRTTDNLSPVMLSATVDGEEVVLAQAENGDFYFTMGPGISQKVSITATDEAGNSDVFAKTISISPNPVVYFLLRFKALIGAAVLAAIALFVLLMKRRKKESK